LVEAIDRLLPPGYEVLAEPSLQGRLHNPTAGEVVRRSLQPDITIWGTDHRLFPQEQDGTGQEVFIGSSTEVQQQYTQLTFRRVIHDFSVRKWTMAFWWLATILVTRLPLLMKQ
jgi:hypothetical protein